MRKLTVILIVVLLVVSTSLSFVGPRKLGDDYLQQGNSLSRQAEFARFIHVVGFTEQQLFEINRLVQSTRQSLLEAFDEAIHFMELAVEEAVAGDIDKSKETEKEARQIAVESRSYVQDFVVSMRNIVTVAQQEKMYELLGSAIGRRFFPFGRFAQGTCMNYPWSRSADSTVWKLPNSNSWTFPENYHRHSPSKSGASVRYLPRRDLFELIEEMPGQGTPKPLPEDARKIIQERLRESFQTLEQMLPKAREMHQSVTIKQSDMIYLIFLQEDNAEVLRRIVEEQ
ncbi:MAG TPA: hypothetical protein DCE14_09000 [Kosmotogaceae bacterium]|nr:hypothetical protein [Kosmotogaceae bacterium]